jgi:hypothetical protein
MTDVNQSVRGMIPHNMTDNLKIIVRTGIGIYNL